MVDVETEGRSSQSSSRFRRRAHVLLITRLNFQGAFSRPRTGSLLLTSGQST